MQKAIYGLIGYPVKHSLSALMHNCAFKGLGIKAEYRLFEISPQRLKDFLLGRCGFIEDINGEKIPLSAICGYNVTVPYKVKAKEFLESNYKNALSAQEGDYSRLAGAVNTVKLKGQKASWINTDVPGFARSLSEDLEFFPAKKFNALVIGCGGAGRAVISALVSRWQGLLGNIYIYDIKTQSYSDLKRHYEDFPEIISRLCFISKEDIAVSISDCSLLINASSAGMRQGDPSPLDSNLLHKGLYVYDVVYNTETRLLEDSRSLGLSACGGLGMLLYQGVEALHFWLDREIGREIVEEMRHALERSF